MNTLIRSICLSILFVFATSTYAHSLPENHSVNGGITIIPIDVKQMPEAYFEGKRIPVLPGAHHNQWLLVVAIPLNNTTPIQYIDITKPYKTKVPFHVSEKFYATQSLTIKSNNLVNPEPQEIARIKQETQKLMKIYATYTARDPFATAYTAPIRGPISSLFGLKRVYNKEPKDPHSGLDIAAAEGVPVHAVSAGVVVEAGNYFFTGNTVIIDHGMGVFSLYAHLSKIEATVGEAIKQGQVLGLVGMTGRVTGPHLHWTMVMNQTLVEPLLFVPYRTISVAPKPAKAPAKTGTGS